MDNVMGGQAADTALQVLRLSAGTTDHVMVSLQPTDTTSWFHCNRQTYVMDNVMGGQAADTALQVLRLTASTTDHIMVSLQQTDVLWITL
ncbi:hypothetical protein J6590_064058 [Homalodisca vitripennis]|nr:hypothetical protein J6590_064058 [Homalodisca vitripennis]